MSGDQSREQMVSGESTPMQLPVFVVRDRVLFPGGLLRLSVGKPKSVRLVESLISKREDQHQGAVPTSGGGPNILLAIFNQRADVPEGRGPDDVAVTEQRSESEGEGRVLSSMYRVGCVARVLQMGRVSASDNFQYSLLVQGVSRVRLLRLYEDGPMLHGMVVRLQEEGSISDAEVKALSLNLREAAQALLEVLRSHGRPRALNAREILDAVSAAAPGAVADILASSINISTEQKQAVLEEISLGARLRLVLEFVREQTHVLSIASKIHSEVEGKLNSRHREYYLRQQLKAIRSELGEEGAGDDDITSLEAKLEAASLPPEASKVVMRDLSRLKKMQSSQPEYTVVRTYLETVSELPWNSWSEETYDIRRTQERLDKDHYGLEKVKRRIIEYVAVRSLLSNSKGSILCLVGPPGVGKTSLGRSIAEALQRKFQRLSLGGVHDEAEIRGHRRTYIGAMPGGIVRCLRRAGTRNPVILLDEVDKIGSNIRGGDPAAALLEVLDPEQNDTFTDHYLNLPFDLSSVLFVATANKVDTIPEPLLDRLEVIHVQGYTLEEKVRIAEAYLVPKQMNKSGVGCEHIMLPKSTILRVAASYTREAGVRQLERELAAICRHVALKVGMWKQDASGTGTLDPLRQTPPPDGPTAGASTTSLLSSDDVVVSSDDASVAERNRSVDAAVSAEVYDSKSGAEDSATPEALGARVGFGSSHEHAATAGVEDGERPLAQDGGQGCSRDRGGGAKGHSPADLGVAGGRVEGVSSGKLHQELGRRREDEPRPNRQESPAFARVVVTCEMLHEILGPEVYESEVAARVAVPGMSTGLAWTPTGGELLFIECASMPGCGMLTLTGKLGEVMRESAQIALSWIRSHEHEICAQLGLGTGGHGTATASHVAAGAGAGAAGAHAAVGVGDDVGMLFPPGFFNEMDIHLHVPAGGVPKDGPSAGVAIASALLSLVLGRAVDTEVAMTGEITLRGLVLPVGGVRDKVLAARRGGIRRVLLPARNRGDLEELPPEASQGLRITLVETIADVVFALFPPLAGDDTSARREAAEAAGDEAAGRPRGRYQPHHGQEPLSAAVGSGGAGSRVYRRVATVAGVGCKKEWEEEDVAAVPLESFL